MYCHWQVTHPPLLSGASMGQRWLRRKRTLSGRPPLLSASESAKYLGCRLCAKRSLSGMKARAEPSAPSSTLFASGSGDSLEWNRVKLLN